MQPEIATVRRHPERAVTEHAADILAAGHVAHVGFVDEGRPVVIPFGYQFDAEEPDRLYLHGGPVGRAIQCMQSGEPVCVTVTLLDGLVYSKTALFHSMNYRSVVCFGRGRRVTDRAVQQRVYERMVSRYFAGRTPGRDYSAPTTTHLDTTALVEIQIEEWSAKMREGGPKGPTDDQADAPGTCGVWKIT
jgi:nitroimidazol reductase NimA-like FMN-containing flavoprotein (pyridoxamine 5'-phosphate oxidase superfamily)